MAATPPHSDVAVIGAGLWGLATAWATAAAGARVVVLDDGAARAGEVAARMVAPWSEVEDDEHPLHAALRDGASAWPALAERLRAASDVDPGFRRTGSLAVAARPAHLGQVRRLREVLRRVDHDATWLTGTALREREPGLGPSVAGGLELADEGQADPRRTLAALRAACARAGVRIEHRRVAALRRTGGTVTGLVTDDGTRIDAERVVLAAGWACGALDDRVPLRPVKGQILTLGPRPDAPTPIRRIIRTPDVYLVPRPDGRVLVGATSEEVGDRVVTAEAVHLLLDEALHTVPGLGALELVEQRAGLRPATPDGLPALGVSTDDGLAWAAGGYRHGVLLLLLVVAAAEALAGGRALPGRLDALSPDRFAAARPKAASCV